MTETHIVGCSLGTAIGDALGLPYEGISRHRAPRLLGLPNRHRFLLKRGMFSDDTEHTCMVAQALIASNLDLNKFTTEFARRLRWWFIAFPAGIGFATLNFRTRPRCLAFLMEPFVGRIFHRETVQRLAALKRFLERKHLM